MKICLTGATGFIGRNLALRLARDGHRVACLVRNRARAAWIESAPSLETVPGDLLDGKALRACARGADLVIHLAACTSASSESVYFDINGRGTGMLAEAAAESASGKARLLYLSSLSAAGPGTSADPATEDTLPRPLSAYGRSKLQGENLLKSGCGGLPWTVIRAPVVYGPYDREVLLLFRLAKRGILLKILGVPTETSLIHVDDLVNALLLAAEREESAGRLYCVSDGRSYSAAEVHGALRLAAGGGIALPLPPALMKAVGLSNDLIARISGRPRLLGSDRVRETVQRGWVCSSERIARELGFSPRIGMKEGFRSTYAWYEKEGWL